MGYWWNGAKDSDCSMDVNQPPITYSFTYAHASSGGLGGKRNALVRWINLLKTTFCKSPLYVKNI